MTLHHDLLEQAAHLLAREPKKPKQASLRRAISTSYYALFHLLVADAARMMSPAKPDKLKHLVGRAFDHRHMRETCSAFVQGNAGQMGNRRIPLATRVLLHMPLERELVVVLEAFVALQEARHAADYDTSRRWSRVAAVRHLSMSQQAFREWAKIRQAPNAAVFAAALLLQRQWSR